MGSAWLREAEVIVQTQSSPAGVAGPGLQRQEEVWASVVVDRQLSVSGLKICFPYCFQLIWACMGLCIKDPSEQIPPPDPHHFYMASTSHDLVWKF